MKPGPDRPLGESLQRQRTVGQMRKHPVRNSGVVRDNVAFGQSRLGIDDAISVADLHDSDASAQLLSDLFPLGVPTGLVLAVDQLALDTHVVHAFLARNEHHIEGAPELIEDLFGHAHGIGCVVSGLAEIDRDIHARTIPRPDSPRVLDAA